MDRIPLAKAIILSIVTLGIYYLILVYRNSRDIHTGRPGGRDSWKVLFWTGFITFGITWIVLSVFNMLRVNEWREEAGLDTTLGFVALVLMFISGFVGSIVWAIYWNETLDQLGDAPTPVPASEA